MAAQLARMFCSLPIVRMTVPPTPTTAAHVLLLIGVPNDHSPPNIHRPRFTQQDRRRRLCSCSRLLYMWLSTSPDVAPASAKVIPHHSSHTSIADDTPCSSCVPLQEHDITDVALVGANEILSHGCVRAQPQTARIDGMLRRRVARSDGSPIFRRASQEEPTSSSLHSQPSSESADRAHGSPRTVPGATHTVSTIATREGETCAGLCAFTSK